MILASDLPKLSRVEKLKLMELLWTDLASSADGLESPEWHRSEVLDAEKRYLAGEEQPVDRNVAKEQLRSGRR